MKAIYLLVSLSALLAACQPTPKTSAIPIINVTANYPQQEMNLQDFAEVEYVPLETTDSFITQAYIQSITPHYIVCTNYQAEGTLYLFDRKTGQGICTFNRKGQGNMEYASASLAILSESTEELFVSDMMTRKMLVYDLKGNFLRSFPFEKEDTYSSILEYDDHHLIVFKERTQGETPLEESKDACHILLSKTDGKVVKEIRIPLEKYESLILAQNGIFTSAPFTTMVAAPDHWILDQTSSDTLYRYTDGQLEPAFLRTPSIHSMEVQKFLYAQAVCDPYLFFVTVEKKFDAEKMRGYPTDLYCYNQATGAITQPRFTNTDCSDLPVHFLSNMETQLDNSVAGYYLLQADQLKEAYEEGKLKGRLKEIASQLNEESNPVLVLLKRK